MDLVPVAEEALRIVRPNAERKAVELKVDLPAEAVVKYTPSDGRVAVSATFSAAGDGAETVTVRVTDTGLGIPARDLPHVFDKFYRVESKATRDCRDRSRARDHADDRGVGRRPNSRGECGRRRQTFTVELSVAR